MTVSTEGIKEWPRGIEPGDRWAVLEKTSPSGKTLFRCMSCGSEGPLPDKLCWDNSEKVATVVTNRKPNLKCLTWQRVKLWRYHLPNDEHHEGWATIVLGADGYFSAVSDYGNYAFRWTHHGEKDFRLFLLNIDWHYAATKLSNARQMMEYDADATCQAVKQHLKEARRKKWLSKEEARFEWDLLEQHEQLENLVVFHDWARETKLSDVYEFHRERFPLDLQAFCKKTLLRLAKVLRQDLRREGLLSLQEDPFQQLKTTP